MLEANFQDYTIELLLRGACAGILVLGAVQFARMERTFGVAGLGALFLLGTAAYAIISTPASAALSPSVRFVTAALATLNSVFMWWFATALFDDAFRWRLWRLIPLFLIAPLPILRHGGGAPFLGIWDGYFQQVVVIAMMVHVLWLALAHRDDDLVEIRRRFRLVFASLVGATGFIIAIVELSLAGAPPPIWLTTFHAFSLFSLTLAFSIWLFEVRSILPRASGAAPMGLDPSPPVHDPAYARLMAAMENGIYKTENLTVRSLADHVGVPEYRMRQLVNQSLKFKNFTAFLNSYRIEEARKILSDPGQARRQITQIALDLGYGSVSPFNRAFKAAENLTPTEFRRQALSKTEFSRTVDS